MGIIFVGRIYLVKMSIVTTDSCIVESNGRQVPCIMLIGRGEDLQRLKRRIPFYPYFYLLEEDYKDLKEQYYFTATDAILASNVMALTSFTITAPACSAASATSDL